MSLNRTAARLAVILALSNNFSEPYGTIAQARVYDSKIDPIEGTDPSEVVPIIIVYTDDDDGEPLSLNNGGPPFRRRISLSIEFILGQVAQQDHGLTIDLPQTDAELEAMLDLFEHQIRFRLADTTNPWTALLWGGVITRIESWATERRVQAEGKVRLAGRQITASVEIPDDLMPTVTHDGVPDKMPMPTNLTTIYEAVAADLEGGYPKANTSNLIALLQSVGIPHTVGVEALKTIYMREGAKADDGIIDHDFPATDLDQ